MKVLMFTVSAGNGHNATAKRLKEKILQEQPEAEIEIVDVYKEYTSKLKAWTMEKGYFFVCNHFVRLYNHFFNISKTSTYENRDKSKANSEVNCILYGMINKIYDYKPDVIISTYIFCSVALANLKRVYPIPATTMCMTLDYDISPYWECCATGLDYMFLTNESMIEPFKKKGYTDKQLIVSGIPVAHKFSNLISKEEACKVLDLDKDLFTIFVMKASFFPIKNKDLINEFSKINKKVQICINNGKDIKCQKDLDKRIKKANLKHNIQNFGYTDKTFEYFSASNLILGKAGGLSMTECINSAVPCLIVDHLPQQEIQNKEFLMKNGCALSVSKNTIADTINKIMEDDKLYTELKNNYKKIQKPGSINIMYDIIAKCPKADYSDIVFNDNKKQVITNVTNARKQAIKERC